MVVSVIRELLRRNPALPPERIGEVAIAATTQTGDQGLTIGRSAAVLAGLPKSVPGYTIDRMCAGAMTAVTRGPGSNRGKSNKPTADLGLFEFLGRLTISVATVRTGSCASVEVVGVGDSVLL